MKLLEKMKDLEIKIHKLEVEKEHKLYNMLAGYNNNYDKFKKDEEQINKEIATLKEELDKLSQQDKERSIKKIQEMKGLL